MSHMHPIDGLSTAAAQYQAYLERMRVAQSKEEEAQKVRRRNQGQKFQEHLESEEEEADESSEEKQGQDEGEQPTEEASQGDGFGSHYA